MSGINNNKYIMEYAPVVIITLCRYSHFKNCIESLERCHNSNKTDVFIGLDYPVSEYQIEGYNKICHYLADSSFSFNKLIVVKREKNYGSKMNYLSLYNDKIQSNYSSWIFSEDDNVFSINFLDFINNNLVKFNNDDRIYAINGYSFPIDYGCRSDNLLKTYMYSPWGVGMWVKKVKFTSTLEADEYIYNMKSAIKLLKHSPYIFESLVSMRYRNLYYGDTVLRARLLLTDMSCISPVSSKVRNCGFDNTGINCYYDGGKHANQEIDCNKSYVETGSLPSVYNVPDRIYNLYFHVSSKKLLKSIIKYFILIIKHFIKRCLM